MNDYLKMVLDTFQFLCRTYGDEKAPGMMKEINKRTRRRQRFYSPNYSSSVCERIVRMAKDKVIRLFKNKESDPVGRGMMIALSMTSGEEYQHVRTIVL